MAEPEAGRALDALIAEKVMGLTLDWDHTWVQGEVRQYRESNGGRGIVIACQGCDLRGFGNEIDWTQRCPTPVCPPYSTDLAAAWEIVAHLIQQDIYLLDLTYFPHAGKWRCRLGMREREPVQEWEDTAPLAICRAALLVVGDE